MIHRAVILDAFVMHHPAAGGAAAGFLRTGAWIWAALSRLGDSMEFKRKLETQPAILRRPPAI
jgi:hypothetical protein